jgi:hypothetical protein
MSNSNAANGSTALVDNIQAYDSRGDSDKPQNPVPGADVVTARGQPARVHGLQVKYILNSWVQVVFSVIPEGAL